jgi:uncharacterized protein
MLFEKDVPIAMRDGNVLRANVFRPQGEGRYPVVMAHGCYGKDVHFSHAFKPQWLKLLGLHPKLCADGSSGQYLRWETVDPERWVPAGYAVVQVDSRGSGKSPGYLDPFSPREIQDYSECIEWAGAQSWSNGKVGLLGVSYYAIEQWQVAALQPKALAAIIPWEGGCDFYRDIAYHGGIASNLFWTAWWPRQVLVNQHGNGASTHVDPRSGERTTGPAALSAALLDGNRSAFPQDMLRHSLADAWHAERTPDLSRVQVPVLSAGNWGGPGVHLRGNVEGFMRAGSRDKWLFMHAGTHFESFYLPEYIALQQRFFDHYLKGLDNGWEREPHVQMLVRAPEGTRERRQANELPLPETKWTRLYLDAKKSLLKPANGSGSSASYDACGPGLTLSTPPLDRDIEIMGFVTLRIWVASDGPDLDLFATLRAFDPAGKEVVFDGAHEPTPVTRGWLRASHRKLDAERSLPYRPWHAHDDVEPLTPGETCALDVELWPTSMVFPKGYRIALTLQGRDFEYEGVAGRILHNDPRDRDPARCGKQHTILTGGKHESYLQLPVID